MSPLIRIYAEIPGLQLKQRIVTDSPLRFIIPIHGDVVMISYTDGRDTKMWSDLEGDALTAAVHREVVRLFGPTKKPLWVRKALWSEGTTFWKPGHYDPYKASTDALEIKPGLYCCGESFSPTHQAWIEGALEHAEALLAHLTGKPVA
jgi:monoamine oxidase